jgi:hypothetical protein
MDIGAFFQCHKQPYATYNALLQFRKAYPTSTIVLLSDNGYDYTKMAEHFNCYYIHSHENLPQSQDYNSNSKILLRAYVSRLVNALSFIKESHFMLLEDDVYVKQRYTDDFLGTINGNCINTIKPEIFKKIEYYKGEYITKYFSGHGGSVYNKSSFLDILNKPETNWLIDNWISHRWDNDLFFSILIHTLGGTVHKLQQHKDGTNCMNDQNAHVVHQYNNLYNIPMSSELEYLYKQ